MRILQILYGKELGGMEKFCIDLSNELSKNHDVYLLASPVLKKHINSKINYIPLEMNISRNNPLHLYKFYKQIKEINPELIHVHKQKVIYLLKRILFFQKIPFVATKHDTLVKKAYSKIEYAISISNEVQKTLQIKNIFNIYNGIPYIKPKKMKLSNVFNIVAVGGLRYMKGYDTLIKAVSKLTFKYHLTIIGEGEERNYLESLIVQLDLQTKVSLVGFKTNVNDYLYSCDLQVISSTREGFSLAMVEGLFYAPLLISTKVGVCPEILPNNLLYDSKLLSLKILDIFENYKFYIILFNNTKKIYTKEFMIQKCAKKHIQAYKDIIYKKEL